jgi:hypothetical protein
MAAEPTPARLALAAAFLQEAVYRSRERQAVGVSLLPARPDGSSPTNCGLGREARVVLDLSSRARELCAELWPAPMDETELERLRDATAAWVERQDAFDRERNHFLRDFRREHDAERTTYTPDVQRAFDAGLAAINSRETRERNKTAATLLGDTRDTEPGLFLHLRRT